jgi:hypothetical protein
MATKITTRSWGSRLGNSIKGILVGLVLFIGSFILLSWNERNAVRQYKTLNEVRIAAVEIQATDVPSASDGKLVHVSGVTQTPDTLEDPEFGIRVTDSIHLDRQVEMYQWEESSRSETRTRVGGGQETVTTYSYDTRWSERLIDSSRFYEQNPARRNPGRMPYSSLSVSASNVGLGNFVLATEIISQIRGRQDLPLWEQDLRLPANARLHGEHIYVGENPASPQVGDVRIKFSVAPAGTVSIIAGQEGTRLTRSWTDFSGNAYARVQTGAHSKEAMITQAEREVKILTWVLRFVGWLVMSVGLVLTLAPLRVMADVLPFVGRLVGTGVGLVSGLVAAGLSLATIAIAWIVVRPMIGIPLLVAAVGLGSIWIAVRRRSAMAALERVNADVPPSPVPAGKPEREARTFTVPLAGVEPAAVAAKICVICGSDCSTAPRFQDDHGHYYHERCYSPGNSMIAPS